VAVRVFISYRRDDSAYAAQVLYERLEAELGTGSVFIDVESIPLGANFLKRLRSEVARCDVLLAVIGNNWLIAQDEEMRRRLDDPSDFVRIELAIALGRGVRLIPVLVDNANMPRADSLPVELRDLAHRNATELRPGSDFRSDLDRLMKHLLEGTGRAKLDQRPGRSAASFSFSQLVGLPHEAVGQALASYQVLDVLGRRNGGVAYRAEAPNMERQVCLMVAYRLSAERNEIMRVVSTAVRGLLALKHPRVARLYDFGELDLADGSSFYLATEYIQGKALESWTAGLEQRPDATRKRLATAMRLAQTLATVHRVPWLDDAGIQQRGILHGNLNPASVLVHPKRGPVLTNFMLPQVQRLRALDGEPPWSDPGLTSGFRAPEELETGVVTPQTDIYGCRWRSRSAGIR